MKDENPCDVICEFSMDEVLLMKFGGGGGGGNHRQRVDNK
jgi:hypothetical protein